MSDTLHRGVVQQAAQLSKDTVAWAPYLFAQESASDHHPRRRRGIFLDTRGNLVGPYSEKWVTQTMPIGAYSGIMDLTGSQLFGDTSTLTCRRIRGVITLPSNVQTMGTAAGIMTPAYGNSVVYYYVCDVAAETTHNRSFTVPNGTYTQQQLGQLILDDILAECPDATMTWNADMALMTFDTHDANLTLLWNSNNFLDNNMANGRFSYFGRFAPAIATSPSGAVILSLATQKMYIAGMTMLYTRYVGLRLDEFQQFATSCYLGNSPAVSASTIWVPIGSSVGPTFVDYTIPEPSPVTLIVRANTPIPQVQWRMVDERNTPLELYPEPVFPGPVIGDTWLELEFVQT